LAQDYIKAKLIRSRMIYGEYKVKISHVPHDLDTKLMDVLCLVVGLIIANPTYEKQLSSDVVVKYVLSKGLAPENIHTYVITKSQLETIKVCAGCPHYSVQDIICYMLLEARRSADMMNDMMGVMLLSKNSVLRSEIFPDVQLNFTCKRVTFQ
jgi:hypothetical protein